VNSVLSQNGDKFVLYVAILLQYERDSAGETYGNPHVRIRSRGKDGQTVWYLSKSARSKELGWKTRKGGEVRSMKNYDTKIVEETLHQMFSPDWLRETARETGLIKRERKVDPVIMFWVLVFGFGVRLQRSLASLKRSYEKTSDSNLSDGSWYERFTPELVSFLKQCVVHGIEHLAQDPTRKNEKLSLFKDVLIQDSTIIRLHEKLAKKWPAVRARKVAAGVKVSMLVSAISDGPKRVALHGERTSEVKTLRIGPWVKDRILLIDLGFYKHQLFTRIKENGGYFVSRLKGSADPLIIGSGKQEDLIGKRVSKVLPELKGELDVEVEVNLYRRKYNGKRRKDRDSFRLIAVYNEEDNAYHTYITNISSDILDAKDISSLYSARWDVELIFKELKSRYALDVVNTTNPQIIEAYIWIAILTLMVSRRIYNLVVEYSQKEKIVRYTQLRWSTIFAENASDQLTLVLAYYGIQRTFETVMGVYDSQALDPHVNRHRLMDEWRA